MFLKRWFKRENPPLKDWNEDALIQAQIDHDLTIEKWRQDRLEFWERSNKARAEVGLPPLPPPPPHPPSKPTWLHH